MRYYQEKDSIQTVLESNRRRLRFEMREVVYNAINRAQASMEKEFALQLQQGNVMNLENDTAESRRFLLEGVFKELNNGSDIQSEIQS